MSNAISRKLRLSKAIFFFKIKIDSVSQFIRALKAINEEFLRKVHHFNKNMEKLMHRKTDICV